MLLNEDSVEFGNYIYKNGGGDIIINTEVHLTATMTFKIISWWTTSAWMQAAGCWLSGYNYKSDPLFYIERNGTGNQYNMCVNTKTTHVYGINENTSHTIQYTGTTLKVDGTNQITGITATEFVPNSTLKVRGPRIYSIQIWDNDVLVHEFKPAVYGNVVGMYDTVCKNMISVTNATLYKI